MMHLTPHHRFHIPNKMAMFAAVLLLISSVAGFDSRQHGNASPHEAIPSIQVEGADNDSMDNATVRKSRGLNLGLLLFRRG